MDGQNGTLKQNFPTAYTVRKERKVELEPKNKKNKRRNISTG
jgi:hypothetical protein